MASRTRPSEENPEDRSVGAPDVSTATVRAASTRSFPPVKFRDPPVIETVLGVQFVPVQELGLPHLGVFWNQLRREYPKHEVKPALAPVVEEFPPPAAGGSVGIQLQSEPEARCWFIDETSTQLIQVQRDRFLRNWRRGDPPAHSYPSFDELRPRFARDWQRFVQFLVGEGLRTPDVNQCEVTYVNHIELGRGWESFGQAHEALTLLAPPSNSFLPRPELVALNTSYAMPDKAGRLHVAAQPAVRRKDGRQVLQLTLTARGQPAACQEADILAWFGLGHEWIVQGFAEITTAKMQKIWGRL